MTDPVTTGVIVLSVFIGCLLLLIILSIVLIFMVQHTSSLLHDMKEKEKERSLTRAKKNKYKYTAIMIETRIHLALEFVITNMYTNLSDEWFIVICHGNKNSLIIKEIATRLDPSRIQTVHLPIASMNQQQYSTFLKSPMFFEHISTEYFLLFNINTMIIPRNKHVIHDFINKNYDFVGAPLSKDVIKNGLSLRKKSKMMEIMMSSPWDTIDEQMFYSCPRNNTILKPTIDESSQFCLETLLSPTAFGCHQPWVVLPHDELFAMYPEIKPLYELHTDKP